MRRCVTFLLGVGAVVTAGRWAVAGQIWLYPDADTFINSAFPDNNNGRSQSLYTGENGKPGTMRSLLRFTPPDDLLQGRATVTHAVLTMVTLGTGGVDETTPPTPATESLQAVSVPWVEGTGFGAGPTSNTVGQACAASGATWNQPNCAGDTPWSGGNVSATISGVADVPAMVDALVTWDSAAAGNAGMVADVQGWMDSPATNQGWRLTSSTEGAASGQAQRFVSRELGPLAGKGPALVLTFACRPGFVEAYEGCAPVGDAGDGSTPVGTPSSGSGCSCGVGAAGASGPGGLLAAGGLLIAALFAARRRTRRSDRARPARRRGPAGSAAE